jgi:thiosulfate/3-mercaptopyruvate sulfurtransferase
MRRMLTTLVSTDTLAVRLAESDLVIVDCRFRLDDEAWGRQEYERRHIPGARYAHLDRDLSGPKTGANGRHPLPDPRELARTFGALGITRGVQVIAYDQDTGIFASRLWWLLRWVGHDAVAVLDGGFAKWMAEGRAASGGVESGSPRTFDAALRSQMAVDVDQVSARIGDTSWRLIDARAPERYRGDVETLDRAAGHIPGALNHFYQQNLDEHGTFRPPADIGARFRDVIGGQPPEHVICYCGSGVTACHNLLALEHAGLRGARLYPGSWSEWSADSSRSIERTGQKNSGEGNQDAGNATRPEFEER